ncbi:proline-rich proteoglycan 2-like [Penaeus monodon]|uniref:proline-rich proteoglycan 2-like n=1 Tax=Penaeus monodon TaxID=6687 RepID=UPI0018A7DBD5|nr:proline-rich proteoglycan 2-like [Penaeus monodon]
MREHRAFLGASLGFGLPNRCSSLQPPPAPPKVKNPDLGQCGKPHRPPPMHRVGKPNFGNGYEPLFGSCKFSPRVSGAPVANFLEEAGKRPPTPTNPRSRRDSSGRSTSSKCPALPQAGPFRGPLSENLGYQHASARGSTPGPYSGQVVKGPEKKGVVQMAPITGSRAPCCHPKSKPPTGPLERHTRAPGKPPQSLGAFWKLNRGPNISGPH